MPYFERQAAISWEGSVREGRGEVQAATGTFTLPVSFPSRVESTAGRTSPEELLAAAHASCFAMALAATLGRRGASASRLHVTATVRAELSEAGLLIHSSTIRVTADGLTGVDPERFTDLAREAESRCPVSNALRGNLQVNVNP